MNVSFQILTVSGEWLKNLFVTPNKKIMLEKSLPEAQEESGIEKGAPIAFFLNPGFPLEPFNAVVTPKCSLEEKLNNVLSVLLSGLKSTERLIYIVETIFAHKIAQRK